MAKRTMQDKIYLYLSFCGFEEKAATSRKYITMEKGDRKYFIGKHGGIRTGKNPSSSHSVDYPGCLWDIIKKWLIKLD